MNILNDLNIGVIIWKKNDTKYHCYINNCGIEENLKLKSYIKKINYGDAYEKIIETGENQSIKHINYNITLQSLRDNIILETRAPANDSMHLLSSISHKIRIPLTNIVGILALIEEVKGNKAYKKNIDILKKSCYDIIEVVNDIIDIINLNRGELKLDIEKSNLNNILHQCYDIVLSSAKEKGLNFKFIVNKNIPDVVLVDSRKLKQIIINMLNNSIQNTNVGGIIVDVSIFNKNNDFDVPFHFTETKAPLYNILFTIKDTGSGMDSATKNYVESLLGINKINPNNMYKYGGFGLIISKYICNLMGGNIWFKSEQNIGTVFYFNIICDGIVLI